MRIGFTFAVKCCCADAISQACQSEKYQQAERVRAEVEAKNAALEAARRAKMEALKLRNWLMGQAMVRNALAQSGLSQAEQTRVQAEARTKGVSAALGLLASLKQAAQARLVASWKAMEQKIQHAEEAAERSAQQQARSSWDMAKWKQQDYAESARWEAQQAYQRYRQGEWADPQPMEQRKSWWQWAGEWISSPSTWWGLSTEDEAVKLMQKTKGFPDIPIILPMLKGFGMDDVAGPLKYTLKTDTTIRLIGRILDDFSPGVLTGIGWGLTVTPNLVKNIRNKNPWHQTTADLIVDTGGFIASEIAGWVAGALAGAVTGGNPVAILATKVVVDSVVSIGWDYLAERYRWSDWLSQHLEKGAHSFGGSMINSMQQAFDTEKYPRVPTPPTPQVTETPTPLGQNPDVQPSGTPVPGHTSMPTAPGPTRPPTP